MTRTGSNHHDDAHVVFTGVGVKSAYSMLVSSLKTQKQNFNLPESNCRQIQDVKDVDLSRVSNHHVPE